MALFWRRRPFDKPPLDAPFEINRNSVQSRGIIGWWPPIASRGTNVLRDLAGGINGTFNGALTWVIQSIGSIGIDFPNAATAYISASTPDNLFLGTISIIWSGVIDTGNAYRLFFTKTADNGATATPFEFRTRNESIPTMVLIRANTTYSQYAGPAVVLGAWHQYGVVAGAVCDIAPTFYIDGCPTIGTFVNGLATGAPTGTGAAIRIGVRPDNVVIMDGKMTELRIYNVALTPAEVWHAYERKWDLYLPTSRIWALDEVTATAVRLSHLRQGTQLGTRTGW